MWIPRGWLVLAILAIGCERNEPHVDEPLRPATPAPAVAPRPAPPAIGFVRALRAADGFVRVSVASVKWNPGRLEVDGTIEAVFKGSYEVGSPLHAVYVEQESPIIRNAGRARAEALGQIHGDKTARHRRDLYLLIHATQPCCRVDVADDEVIDPYQRSLRELQDTVAAQYTAAASLPDDQAILAVLELGLDGGLTASDIAKPFYAPSWVCGDLEDFAAAGKTSDPKRLAEIMRKRRDRAIAAVEGGFSLEGASPSISMWVVAFLDRDDQVRVAKHLLASYLALRAQRDAFDARARDRRSEGDLPMPRENLSWPLDRILESMEELLDAERIRIPRCPGSHRRRTEEEVVAQIRQLTR